LIFVTCLFRLVLPYPPLVMPPREPLVEELFPPPSPPILPFLVRDVKSRVVLSLFVQRTRPHWHAVTASSFYAVSATTLLSSGADVHAVQTETLYLYTIFLHM